MSTNVGTFDRLFRAILGLALLYLALMSGLPLFATSLIKYAAVAVGLVMLTTSAFKLCPLYSILGIKTCKEC